MSWLSNKDIAKKIQDNADLTTLNAFGGIYPINKLPSFVSNYPFFIIINTHSHNLPGEHWNVIYIDANKCGELYDSLAVPVSNIVIKWLNQFTRKWKTNRLMYQHPSSSVCGAFAIYFVLKRLSMSNFETLLQSFTTSPSVNDMQMFEFFNGLK